MATQNAADAVTISSAQWMARGMNAVAATNHLIGEVTGLVVAIEALGGPEFDQGMVDYPELPEKIDTANRMLVDGFVAPINGLIIYGVTPPLTLQDQQFLKLINNIVSPDDERKKFRAFATVYDSKFTLKVETLGCLVAKSIANIGLFVPPPWGFATAPPAWAVHIASDLLLVKIGTEYVLLEGLQASLVGLVPIKMTAETMIPFMAAHGDFLAGNGGQGVVNEAVADEVKRLSSVYQVETSLFPAAADLRLPIQAEPAPSLRGTAQNEPEWGKDEFIPIDTSGLLGDLSSKIKTATSQVNDRITALQQGVTMLNGLEAKVDEQLKNDKLTPEERVKFENEKQQIGVSRTAKQQRIQELKDGQATQTNQENQLNAALGQLPGSPTAGGNGNISARDEHLAKDKMKQSEERYTQWVRATYPYVDSYRAPLLAQFEFLLILSRATEHYRKWTDRYTLTNAWEFRSGFRFQRTSDNRGRWSKSGNPLNMYVMIDAFQGSGERKDQKGHEPWTADSDPGKQKAEQLFTLVGIAQRDKETIFSPALYKRRKNDSVTTFAQAIFYNANEQRPEPIGAKSKTQALVGWDTLNWNPATPAPEWGAEPTKGSAKWPWDVFSTDAVLKATAGVRLNWQAKLMPVTESRFDEAANSNLANAKMKNDITKAQPFFKQLVTH
jgi:hypothetical protein